MIRNRERIEALGNKDYSIRNFCPKDCLIVDTDADDFLVGQQVFQVLNALYDKKKIWFMYSKLFFKKPGN